MDERGENELMGIADMSLDSLESAENSLRKRRHSGENKMQREKTGEILKKRGFKRRMDIGEGSEKGSRKKKEMEAQQSDEITPLSEFNSVMNSISWKAKIRITSKGDLREFQNDKGKGVILDMIIIDEAGTQASLTAWNEQAMAFNTTLQQDKVYYLSTAKIVPILGKAKRFSRDKFELRVDESTTMGLIEDDKTIPRYTFDFTFIKDIHEYYDMNIPIDLVGVLLDISEIQQGFDEPQLFQSISQLIDQE